MEYFGTDTSDPMQAHFPGLHQEAARWLAKERKVFGVGLDAPSIDCGFCGNHYGFPTHVALSEANIYVLENIDKSIFSVPVVGATITVLPINILGASGAPARIVAQYTHNHHDTNPATVAQLSPAVLLLVFIAIIFARRH